MPKNLADEIILFGYCPAALFTAPGFGADARLSCAVRGGAGVVTRVSAKRSEGPDLAGFGLSDREAEVVGEVTEGLSNREIAEKLFLSEGTVRNYISAALEKLGLRDRTQLAVFYYKHF